MKIIYKGIIWIEVANSSTPRKHTIVYNDGSYKRTGQIIMTKQTRDPDTCSIYETWEIPQRFNLVHWPTRSDENPFEQRSQF